MWQWHLWAGPGAPGVWVSIGALVGQGDPWWPTRSGLAGLGLGPGPTSCRWSPLWAALSGSGCCSTRSPARPPGGPAAAPQPGCRRRRQSCGDAARVPPAGLLRGSAGRSGPSSATISASGCPGHLSPEAPISCGEESINQSVCNTFQTGQCSSKCFTDDRQAYNKTEQVQAVT